MSVELRRTGKRITLLERSEHHYGLTDNMPLITVAHRSRATYAFYCMPVVHMPVIPIQINNVQNVVLNVFVVFVVLGDFVLIAHHVLMHHAFRDYVFCAYYGLTPTTHDEGVVLTRWVCSASSLSIALHRSSVMSSDDCVLGDNA
jgi:hypothetical protein